MINAIGKQNLLVPYYEVPGLTKKEAKELLKDNSKVLVAFHEDAYTLAYLSNGYFYGVYWEDVSKILLNKYTDTIEYTLSILTKELILKVLHNKSRHQKFNPHGWGRFFSDHDEHLDINLKRFRVYDLEGARKGTMSSLALLD